MAIRFTCPACYRSHRVADHLAGRPGRCKCGYGFTTPGTAPPPAPGVFVPAAGPNPFATGGLYPRPARGAGWGEALRTMGVGLMVAILIVGFAWTFRDTLVESAPALAPLLPPKVAARPPAKPAPPAPVQAGPSDRDLILGLTATTVASISMLVGLFTALVVLPLVSPMVLSRKNYLSTARWLIMAGASFFLALLFGAILTVLLFPFGLFLNLLSPFVWATLGCLVAAAISPKSLAQ